MQYAYEKKSWRDGWESYCCLELEMFVNVATGSVEFAVSEKSQCAEVRVFPFVIRNSVHVFSSELAFRLSSCLFFFSGWYTMVMVCECD